MHILAFFFNALMSVQSLTHKILLSVKTWKVYPTKLLSYVKATFTNGHVILKVRDRINTGFIQNTKLALFRVMCGMESLIPA